MLKTLIVIAFTIISIAQTGCLTQSGEIDRDATLASTVIIARVALMLDSDEMPDAEAVQRLSNLVKKQAESIYTTESQEYKTIAAAADLLVRTYTDCYPNNCDDWHSILEVMLAVIEDYLIDTAE